MDQTLSLSWLQVGVHTVRNTPIEFPYVSPSRGAALQVRPFMQQQPAARPQQPQQPHFSVPFVRQRLQWDWQQQQFEAASGSGSHAGGGGSGPSSMDDKSWDYCSFL